MTSRPVIAAAVICTLIVGGLIALLATSESGRNTSVNFEIVGKVAPPIEGATIDGGSFDLRDRRGSWVVVNFFASWCVGCRVEHPELVAFSESHVDDGIELVSVMFGDTEQAAQEFFAELGGSWPTLVSDTGGIAIDYGVTGVPETLLVAPTGRVVQKWVSVTGVTQAELDEAIAGFEGNG